MIARTKKLRSGLAAHVLQPYESLVSIAEKADLRGRDLWPIVLYFKSWGVTRGKMAERLGISYSTLQGVIYEQRPLSDAFRGRLRVLMSVPLESSVTPSPAQRSPLERLPDPVRDDQPIPEPSGPLLSDHLRDSYATERPLGEKTLAGYSEAVKRFGHWLGRGATLGDLTDKLVNRWLMALEREGVSKITQHGLRRRVLAIWRHAFESELISLPPMRVRKVRPERRVPRAWTPEDVQVLLSVAAKKRGRFICLSVPRAAFWTAFIRTAFETGLRLGDLLSLRRDQFNDSGELTILQSKTGNEIVCRVWPETMQAIDATAPRGRPFVFGGVISRDYVFQEFRRMVKAAGLRGSCKWLRRAGATAIEREHPGMASAFLGHRSPGLAAQSYIDPRHVQRAKPMPPRLAPSKEGNADAQ